MKDAGPVRAGLTLAGYNSRLRDLSEQIPVVVRVH